MSVNNFNNLPKPGANTIGASSVGGGSSVQPASGTAAGTAGKARILGGGVDWFSQLDAGKAHTMTPQDQFGKNPPLQVIVDEIARHLGIED